MTDRHAIELPALDGTDPVGFLAALGVLRALSDRGPAALSFDPATGLATLHGAHGSIGEVAAALADRFEQMAGVEISFGLPGALVPAKVGTLDPASGRVKMSGSDPARISQQELSALAREYPAGPISEWVAALWTDLSDEGSGRCARTPFNAPAGQQTYRSMFEKSIEAVAEAPLGRFEEALRSWRRVPEFTGENLDARASREAAQQVVGTAAYGVPGATFLALAALPFFRISGNGRLAGDDPKQRGRTERRAVAWHRVRTESGRRRVVFAWPLWRQPLDALGVACLLDHPALRWFLSSLPEKPERRTTRDLRALGVWSVVMTARHQSSAGKSQGFLTVERSWRIA